MQETLPQEKNRLPFSANALGMPSVFWMVTETGFGGLREQAVVGIFDSSDKARHFIYELQHCGVERGTLSVSMVPWSGADGGYVPGSELPEYRPLRCVTDGLRPNCDFDDG